MAVFATLMSDAAMTIFATVTSSVTMMSGVTLISVVTGKCCDPGNYSDCDRCED